MLVVFGLLITAAMKVIFSSAENDAAVVANAVTVLFIADLVRGCWDIDGVYIYRLRWDAHTNRCMLRERLSGEAWLLPAAVSVSGKPRPQNIMSLEGGSSCRVHVERSAIVPRIHVRYCLS